MRRLLLHKPCKGRHLQSKASKALQPSFQLLYPLLWRKLERYRRALSTLASATHGPAQPSLPRVFVISGPTAVGKTNVSLDLAEAVGGEVVSADSVQVYKGLDIGSDKVPVSERRGIPHYLLDILPPTAEFSAGLFYDRADAAIADILQRGKVPIVVGGTGLYVRWLVHGKPGAPASTPEIDARAESLLEQAWAAAREEKGAELTPAERWEAGVAVITTAGDPDTAARVLLERNNYYRLRRQLAAVLAAGGIPLSSLKQQSLSSLEQQHHAATSNDCAASSPARTAANAEPDATGNGSVSAPCGSPQQEERRAAPEPAYDFRCFFLHRPRMELYRRIDARCEQMLTRGLLQEAQWLLDQGITPQADHCAARAIGYRHAMLFLQRAAADPEGTLTDAGLDALLADIQAGSRQYCHRQLTWARGETSFRWVDAARERQAVLADILAAAPTQAQLGSHDTSLGLLTKLETKEMRSYVPKMELMAQPAVRQAVLAQARQLAAAAQGMQNSAV